MAKYQTIPFNLDFGDVFKIKVSSNIDSISIRPLSDTTFVLFLVSQHRIVASFRMCLPSMDFSDLPF